MPKRKQEWKAPQILPPPPVTSSINWFRLRLHMTGVWESASPWLLPCQSQEHSYVPGWEHSGKQAAQGNSVSFFSMSAVNDYNSHFLLNSLVCLSPIFDWFCNFSGAAWQKETHHSLVSMCMICSGPRKILFSFLSVFLAQAWDSLVGTAPPPQASCHWYKFSGFQQDLTLET